MPLFQGPSGEYFCELASETCRSIGELTCNDQRLFLAAFCRHSRQHRRRPPPSQTPRIHLCPTPNCPTNAQQNCLSHFFRNWLIRIRVILRTLDFARPQGTEKREREWARTAENGLHGKVPSPQEKPRFPLGERGLSHAKRNSLQRVYGGGMRTRVQTRSQNRLVKIRVFVPALRTF